MLLVRAFQIGTLIMILLCAFVPADILEYIHVFLYSYSFNFLCVCVQSLSLLYLFHNKPEILTRET